MNFAPYASPPSSPPPQKKQTNWFAPSTQASTSYQAGGHVDALNGTHASSGGETARVYSNIENASSGPEAYETRFGWRVDLQSLSAYAGGPIVAFLLLILETHNSYVRFHAYQSLLFCSVLGILHLLFIWSSRLSWLLVFFDIGSLAYLAFKAYEDGHDLIRYKLPVIGDYADRWVEDE